MANSDRRQTICLRVHLNLLRSDNLHINMILVVNASRTISLWYRYVYAMHIQLSNQHQARLLSGSPVIFGPLNECLARVAIRARGRFL